MAADDQVGSVPDAALRRVIDLLEIPPTMQVAFCRVVRSGVSVANEEFAKRPGERVTKHKLMKHMDEVHRAVARLRELLISDTIQPTALMAGSFFEAAFVDVTHRSAVPSATAAADEPLAEDRPNSDGTSPGQMVGAVSLESIADIIECLTETAALAKAMAGACSLSDGGRPVLMARWYFLYSLYDATAKYGGNVILRRIGHNDVRLDGALVDAIRVLSDFLLPGLLPTDLAKGLVGPLESVKAQYNRDQPAVPMK